MLCSCETHHHYHYYTSGKYLVKSLTAKKLLKRGWQRLLASWSQIQFPLLPGPTIAQFLGLPCIRYAHVTEFPLMEYTETMCATSQAWPIKTSHEGSSKFFVFLCDWDGDNIQGSHGSHPLQVVQSPWTSYACMEEVHL